MTGNKERLDDFQVFQGEKVTFGGGEGQEQRATSDAERLGLGFANDAEELQKRACAKTVPPGSIPVPTSSIPVPSGDTMVSTDDVPVYTRSPTDSFFDDDPTTRFPSPSDLGIMIPHLDLEIKNSQFQSFKSFSELIQERQLHKSLGERPGDHSPVSFKSNSRRLASILFPKGILAKFRKASPELGPPTIQATIDETPYTITEDLGMVSNIENVKKFLMYPRFLQTILGIETSIKRPYQVLKFSSKLFANIRLNFEGHPLQLLAAMLSQVKKVKVQGAAGTENRPPMLVESDYESWKIRIEWYIRGKPLGKLIWRSIQNGPTPHPQITVTEGQGAAAVQVTKDKTDEEFTEIENNRELDDIQATNILNQGLLRHEELFDEYERFRAIGNESIHDCFVRFHKLINDMTITQLDIPAHQMNIKFVNNLPPYWAKYVTNVKNNKDIYVTTYVELYTYLKSYEPHAFVSRAFY
nr:hypothetical protein [Tanacetum cinerariifolium]